MSSRKPYLREGQTRSRRILCPFFAFRARRNFQLCNATSFQPAFFRSWTFASLCSCLQPLIVDSVNGLIKHDDDTGDLIFPRGFLDVVKPFLGNQAEASLLLSNSCTTTFQIAAFLRYILLESRHRCQACAPHVLKLNSTQRC